MKHKDLKIDFRYLTENIACLSVDSISGESVHNDINNEEAIIIFNSLVGEKENCQTVKVLLKENNQLKEQLDCLRSGEYLNQLRFERDILQHVVDNNEVSKEDKEFIDMTHRNTELLEENQKLKKQLEDHIKAEMKAKDESEKLRKEYQETYKDVRVEIKEYKTQQKEFIEYLEKTIIDSKAGSGQQYYYQQLLEMYKEIIGSDK